jgi:asparagine synthase (glutamine-hydrolysing)
MCGIFCLLNQDEREVDTYKKEFEKGKARGPDDSKFITYYKEILGFHRLSINGLNAASNQPITIDNVVLICNGEIYNYNEIYKELNVKPQTDSDCEAIIHLYLKYGMEATLNYLDGVFAFVLYDMRHSDTHSNRIFIARDPYGVRPLFQSINECTTENGMVGFASELKCLNHLSRESTITQFKPGTYSCYEFGIISSTWKPTITQKAYIIPTFAYSNPIHNLNDIYYNIQNYLSAAVYKRCINTERPFACLLSGGLDSSLITALANEYQKQLFPNKKLKTFSIGLANSEDVKYAKIVANYLDTDHTEIIITEKDFFEAIPEVIYAIESYDTTTVRASIGNYLIGKYISQHSDVKVVFNGDGSDELFGGYLYMNACPNNYQFDIETRRLLQNIHFFDVLRSDKCISSHGLEPRTPFLDKTFVNYILSIPPEIRNHNNFAKIEKYLLRNSFDFAHFQNSHGFPLLPSEILYRKKEAFSDGVSTKGRSLFVILQENIQAQTKATEAPSLAMEKHYYKHIFDSFFPNRSHVIPYLWMPQFIEASDPSARTLPIYKTAQ